MKMIVSLIVVVLLIVLIAAMPPLLSTGWGSHLIFKAIASNRCGNLEADQLKLRWLGEQRAQGLRLLTPKGERVATASIVTLHLGLLPLLFGKGDLGRVELKGLKLDLITDEEGGSNLQSALKEKGVEKREPHEAQSRCQKIGSHLPDTGPFVLPNAAITLTRPKPPVTLFELISLGLLIPLSLTGCSLDAHFILQETHSIGPSSMRFV